MYGAILAASDGRVILLSEESCACSGGKTHLGLTEKREIPWKMLVEGEKLGYDVKSILGWENAIYRDERLALLEYDNLPHIPWEQLRGIVEAIELSTAGRAVPSKEFERMTEKMRSRRERL